MNPPPTQVVLKQPTNDVIPKKYHPYKTPQQPDLLIPLLGGDDYDVMMILMMMWWLWWCDDDNDDVMMVMMIMVMMMICLSPSRGIEYSK
jgi:hypothetical protein